MHGARMDDSETTPDRNDHVKCCKVAIGFLLEETLKKIKFTLRLLKQHRRPLAIDKRN